MKKKGWCPVCLSEGAQYPPNWTRMSMRSKAKAMTATMLIGKLWNGASYSAIGAKLNLLSDVQVDMKDKKALEKRAKQLVRAMVESAGIKMCAKHPLKF